MQHGIHSEYVHKEGGSRSSGRCQDRILNALVLRGQDIRVLGNEQGQRAYVPYQ